MGGRVTLLVGHAIVSAHEVHLGDVMSLAVVDLHRGPDGVTYQGAVLYDSLTLALQDLEERMETTLEAAAEQDRMAQECRP